jgi:MarR family transcriptional regulator, transcriptional regulator for hemolysin
MAPPRETPIGLELSRTARTVSRAFEATLSAAGGSLATWWILVSLLSGAHATQREIARAVGLEGPTLTHHLTRMEADGLVARERDPADRRAQLVTLTGRGKDEFLRLRDAVAAFDRRLRTGLSAGEADTLRRLLVQVRGNVGDDVTGASS